jgi:thiol-disulfide isomerase/thioredoxin
METGWVDRSVLDKPEYSVFRTTYDSVHVGEQFVEMIRSVQAGVDFIVFFGTWCEDSEREVPRFLKIADLAEIPADLIRLYGLDRSKKSSDGLTDKFDIKSVPTIIFLRNGREIGRIVEKPQTTVEEDMLSILAGAQSQE